jgi:ligand-binding SRPBCC domain-containing protein
VTHTLRTSEVLPLPVETVFAFFSDAANLEKITPPELHFRILTPLPIEMRPGALIDYELRLFGIRFRWRTRIASWDPPHAFSDEQLRGPYREWLHTHRFEPVEGGTRMSDEVRYRLPLWPLGELGYPIVRLQVRRIFRYRQETIRRLLLENPGSAAG